MRLMETRRPHRRSIRRRHHPARRIKANRERQQRKRPTSKNADSSREKSQFFAIGPRGLRIDSRVQLLDLVLQSPDRIQTDLALVRRFPGRRAFDCL
jgi:hypothetical protein